MKIFRKQRTEVNLADLKLKAVLAEFDAMRSEILERLKFFNQEYKFFLTVLGAVYVFLLKFKLMIFVIFIPMISYAFLLSLSGEYSMIFLISEYIRQEIEERKIPEILGARTLTNDSEKSAGPSHRDLYMGWEHFHRSTTHKMYHRGAMMIWFFLLSVIPPGIVFYIFFCKRGNQDVNGLMDSAGYLAMLYDPVRYKVIAGIALIDLIITGLMIKLLYDDHKGAKKMSQKRNGLKWKN